MMRDFEDEITPINGLHVPKPEELPYEFALVKHTLVQMANQRKQDLNEHKEHRKALRSLWMAVLGMGIGIILSFCAALVQMGQYMERIDRTAQSIDRIEAQVQTISRRVP